MKTVILGASDNPARISFLTANRLKDRNAEFELVGLRKGVVAGKEILSIQDKPHFDEVHTITMYIGSQNQPPWYDYILSLKPKRIIFNPGTENDELRTMAKELGIDTEFACTLTLLSVGLY